MGETPQLALNLGTNALQLIPVFAKAFRASNLSKGNHEWHRALGPSGIDITRALTFPSLAPAHVIHFELDLAPHPTRRLQRSSP